MTDILDRLQAAMHEESAFHSPRTTKAIEAMREAMGEIEKLQERGTGCLRELIEARNEAEDLRYEIERLQALLAMALPYVDGPTEPGPSLRAAINEAVGGN